MSANNESSTGAFLAGFIIGGLVGAVAALVLAPQSGEKTRSQLMQQGNWVRDSGYRQSQAASEYATTAREAVSSTAEDVAEAAEQAPRIVLNGGRTTMTDAADEETGG